MYDIIHNLSCEYIKLKSQHAICFHLIIPTNILLGINSTQLETTLNTFAWAFNTCFAASHSTLCWAINTYPATLLSTLC